jgi:hypothetical protein
VSNQGDAEVLQQRAAVAVLTTKVVDFVSVSHDGRVLATQHRSSGTHNDYCSLRKWLFFVQLVFGYIHAKGQAFVLKELLDLNQGLLAEVAELEEFVHIILDQFGQGVDLGSF